MDALENVAFRSPKQKALVSQLYKDLRFVREYEELKIQQAEELDLVYILGNLSDANRQQEIFLPLAADESISMTKIGDIQEYLLHRHNSSKLTLALMDSDSTTVYFCITPGLLPPSDLEGVLYRNLSKHDDVSSSLISSFYRRMHSMAFITAPNEEVAKTIARGLVSEKLAACVNIIPKITSVYSWEGKVNEDSEVLMMVKTRTVRLPELTEYVKKHHPYDVCEVISTEILQGNKPYLDWILESVPEKAE